MSELEDKRNEVAALQRVMEQRLIARHEAYEAHIKQAKAIKIKQQRHEKENKAEIRAAIKIYQKEKHE